MIAKGRSNVKAMIQDQYEILVEMIRHIDTIYQNNASDFEQKANNYASEAANGDMGVYNSVRQLFVDEEFRNEFKCYEARKMLLCMVFSYYESVINEMVCYYGVNTKAHNPSDIIKALYKFYKKQTATQKDNVIDIVNEPSELARLLRNTYMHGRLAKDKDRKQLSELSLNDDRIGCVYYIKDLSFVTETLEGIKGNLLKIEELLSSISK